MDSIFGFRSMIAAVRSLFPKQFPRVIEDDCFNFFFKVSFKGFFSLCSRICSNSVRDRQFQTNNSGRNVWYQSVAKRQE